MKNIRLCDAVPPCVPSASDPLCARCVLEQYVNLIDEIDDYDYYDDFFIDEDYEKGIYVKTCA